MPLQYCRKSGFLLSALSLQLLYKTIPISVYLYIVIYHNPTSLWNRIWQTKDRFTWEEMPSAYGR